MLSRYVPIVIIIIFHVFSSSFDCGCKEFLCMVAYWERQHLVKLWLLDGE
jgi:hypothetical protein